MKLTDMNTNAKSAVMVDLYLWVLEFAKGAGLSEEKTSIFFTILKMTHEYAVGGKQMEESFEYCKRLLLIHSIKGVEGHVSLLTQRDVQLFTGEPSIIVPSPKRLIRIHVLMDHPNELPMNRPNVAGSQPLVCTTCGDCNHSQGCFAFSPSLSSSLAPSLSPPLTHTHTNTPTSHSLTHTHKINSPPSPSCRLHYEQLHAALSPLPVHSHARARSRSL